MEFVCHAPSDYYKPTNTPYQTRDTGPELCYIWTHIGPNIRTVPTKEEIFGPRQDEERERLKSPRDKGDKAKKQSEKTVLVKTEL